MTAALNAIVTTLLDAAYDSLAGCLTEWQEPLARSEWSRLRQTLTEARRGRVADQVRAASAATRSPARIRAMLARVTFCRPDQAGMLLTSSTVGRPSGS